MRPMTNLHSRVPVRRWLVASQPGRGAASRRQAPPVPSTYLARLAAARIPADAAAVVVKPLDGGALSWSANAEASR